MARVQHPVSARSFRLARLLPAAMITAVVPLAPANAAETTIRASAKVVKSLTLTKKQDLDFGTVTLSGAAGSYTVSMSVDGLLSCPVGATCAGTATAGLMNVQGSNRSVVRINVAPASLVNPDDGSSIAFTPLAPASVTLTNSGAPGMDFGIGGSISVPSTADGTYSGNVQVTVEYE